MRVSPDRCRGICRLMDGSLRGRLWRRLWGERSFTAGNDFRRPESVVRENRSHQFFPPLWVTAMGRSLGPLVKTRAFGMTPPPSDREAWSYFATGGGTTSCSLGLSRIRL